VVLVDTGTAGPGEILAAALLDAGRTLVGEHTFGRAGVQKTLQMPEGGLLLLTVAKYTSPKGTPIHGKGIEPTVAVEGEASADESAPHKDAILEKALEVLKTPAGKAA
jgi:carboxyl-terminal processing protease